MYRAVVQIRDIKIDGTQATVQATVQRNVQLRGPGGRQTLVTDSVFTLQKRGNTWVIVDVRRR